MNKIIVIGRAPAYRPSGRGGANVIFSTRGCVPTLTTQCAHSTPPLVAVEVANEN